MANNRGMPQPAWHNSMQGGAPQLKALVERIEQLEKEKKELAKEVRDLFAEAKGAGFEVKVLRRVLALRKLSSPERSTELALVEVYCRALGMQLDLPLEGDDEEASGGD